MRRNKTLMLAAAAVVLVTAGVFLSMHRSGQQADMGGGKVFADLENELGNIEEIRLSKGDGSRTTLRRVATGWTVVERQFPADALRVRELALGFANLRVVERKTADPANYGKLGVESPDTPAAAGTLVEVVAGKQTWSLIVGKAAEGRAVYVRQPTEPVSLLAAPLLVADPDQKRWIDRLIIDLDGAQVHEVSARVGKGPAYLLTRAQPGAGELTLSPVARGRSPASNMSLSGQTEALASFHFDDVRAQSTPPEDGDQVIYRTFDGQVIEFKGRREAAKAYISVTASRDAALASKFATPAEPAAEAPATTEAPKPLAADRIIAHAQGVEFEIPTYKYEALFRPYEELLEPK